MTWFEVYIPARTAGGKNVTLTVEAPNWIGALKTGLSNIGEASTTIANVMCDIKEDSSIHVTDVTTQRVFRLREVSGPPKSPPPVSIPDGAPVKPITVKIPPPPPKESAPSKPQMEAVKTKPLTSPAVPAHKQSGPVAPPTPRGVPAPPPKRLTGQFQQAPEPAARVESDRAATDPKIGRDVATGARSITDAVADVFDATQDLLMQERFSADDVADKLLDIALQHVPADAGSFYVADIAGHELRFAAVRGPKAAEIKKLGVKVAVGQGIIGFCAQEGICLSISDIQKDPRYFSQIADAVGYKPQNTLCASAEKDGRLFGAIQLINAKGTGGFDATHMEVVRYIGLTAAAMLERVWEQGH